MTSATKAEPQTVINEARTVKAGLFVGEPGPVPVLEPEALPGPGVPDPPAKSDSCAKPIEGGEERKTLYTFFRKVSPTTQLGFPDPLGRLLPKLRSKIAPVQSELPRPAGPKFMSLVLIGHDLPPNAKLTFILDEHGKV